VQEFLRLVRSVGGDLQPCQNAHDPE
jgi:hypothetical protein